MKSKYGDQDEEEREMRLALIGAKDVKNFDAKMMQKAKDKFSDPSDPSYDDGMLPDDDDAEDNEVDVDDVNLNVEEGKEEGDDENEEDENPEDGDKEAEQDPPEEDKVDEDLDEGLL